MIDNLLMGMRIVESPLLTVSKTVERTWRERLFSWPWRPWRATRVERVPDPSFYRIEDHTIVGHPATVQSLKNAIRRETGE